MMISILTTGAVTTLSAQDISGTWSGDLELPGAKLTLVFHIQSQEQGWTGTMDSPDQQVTGIPISSIAFEPPKLRLEVQNGVIVYEGEMVSKDSVSGTFRQSGMSFPVGLKRGVKPEIKIERPQTPVPPFPYESKEVRFVNEKADDISLAGTLTFPSEGSRFPGVVLISGSGPQDRDETLFGHKPFAVIADYLSRSGLAVLRFDDRGTAGSEGDFAGSTTEDFTTDVEAAVRFLRQQENIDPEKVGLIGHSEGGIIASMVAASDPDLDYIVLLAGPGLPGADLLLMQNEALGRASGMPEEKLKELRQINRRIYDVAKSGKEDGNLKEELTEAILAAMPDHLSSEEKREAAEGQAEGLLAPWMKYFLKNDPREYLEKVKCRVLAINGGKDLQVPAEENLTEIRKALTAGGNNRVVVRDFPELNHLFQEADTGLPAEYGKIEMTFSPEALEFMSEWILTERE